MSVAVCCESANDSFDRHADSLDKILQHKEFCRKIFTLQEVKNLARSAISTNAEVTDYYLRPFSEEKLGFLASHQCLVVVANRPGIVGLERCSFFVKAIPFDVPSQVSYIEEKGAFRKEVGFFKSVVPILMENFKGEEWVPRAHLVKDDVIVFDDMKYKGFTNKPKFLELESVKSAVACIARYHAASMLAEMRLGKPLNEVFPEVYEESEFKRSPCGIAWLNTAMNLAVSVAEELGLDGSSIRKTSRRVYDFVEPSKKKQNVSSHGDLWSNNLLFDEDNRCRLVDFQLIRYAPLAHDVMQLIYLTMTRELRGRCEREVIEHYYARLKDCLAENDFRGQVPSFQELMLDAEEQRLWAMIAAVANYPTIMIDSKIGDAVMSDLDAYQAYFLRDRKPFVDKVIAQDPEYGCRVKEIVREFAEMCTRYE